MDRTRLLTEILHLYPSPGETIYLERVDDDYHWHIVDPGAALPGPGSANQAPDAWIFYSGTWPSHDTERMAAHLDDLLAEMESMSGGAERCRWPLDQPYPLDH